MDVLVAEEDFVPDYEEVTEEEPQGEAAEGGQVAHPAAEQPAGPVAKQTGAGQPTRNRGKSWCTLCHTKKAKLRSHIEQEHLPWWFTPERTCWMCQQMETSACFLKQRHTLLGHDTVLTDARLQEWLGSITRAGTRLAEMTGNMECIDIIHGDHD